MKNLNQLFHIVNFSPWPMIICVIRFFVFSSLVVWIKKFVLLNLLISFLFIIFIMLVWWRDVIRESLLQGFHTLNVQTNLKIRILLFIFREVLFFRAFFWTFLHSSLSPTLELGLIWPPLQIIPLNPFRIPFLNTLVLVRSGLTITWRHHSLINNKNSQSRLFITIFLGFYFTFLQFTEYKETIFSIADSIYGSIFFVGTGFHGIHVLIGSIFLTICSIRLLNNQFSSMHLIGYEIAIWYWHFVDVIWLFLFSLIYWWGF